MAGHTKVPGVRASQVMWDGAIPIVVQTGRQAWAASAVSNLGGVVVPWRAYLQRVWLRPLVTATSANALVNLGTESDADGILDGYSLENVAPGLIELSQDGDFVSAEARIIPAGSTVLFELEAATAVGAVALAALLVPAEQAGV